MGFILSILLSSASSTGLALRHRAAGSISGIDADRNSGFRRCVNNALRLVAFLSSSGRG
jgi:hypothetical protein